MSLAETAKTVADQIRRQQYIEVYAHHDADGIADRGYPLPCDAQVGHTVPVESLCGDPVCRTLP